MKKLLALLALAAPALAHAEPRPVSLADAIGLTLEHSPDLALAKAAVAGADARTDGARARRLPSLRVDATGNLYSEPYQVDFGGALFTLHEQTTSIAQVRITQPLTGLAYLSELVGAARHDTRAARAEYDRTRLDTAYATAEAFVRVLEARATAVVAHQSVADIAGSLDRARKLRQADSVTDVDVLRLSSAKAAADQAAVRADTAAEVAVAQLGFTIGLGDEQFAPVDDLPATPPPLAMAVDEAMRRALSTRPELRVAREQLAAAGSRVTSAKEMYLPDVRAFAVYQHTTGSEPFQPTHEELVGVSLSWNVWDWGATGAAVREAESARSRAALGADALAARVRLDVRKHWLEAKAGFDNLDAARVQLESAEEAFRLQKVRFDAGAATATDVLDGETEVARARLQSALARYDYYLGLLSLARSVGDLPRVE